MNVELFAVYDRKSEMYHAAIYASQSVATIGRQFEGALKSGGFGADHVYVTHPQDFVLRRIGRLDLNTGSVIGDVEPFDVFEFSSR